MSGTAGIGLPITHDAYTEEELAHILDAIRDTLDVPRRKSEEATKTLLIDFFGTANSGKTKTTEQIERVFRRSKMNVYCPPETAEVAEIRNRSVDNPLIFQARHLTGVQHYVLNLAYDRNFHVAVISRGLIDMLYWYERGHHEGLFSDQHYRSVRNQILEFLQMDLVDAFFFFRCSAEEALRREYSQSITQKRGSNMNEQTLAEAFEIYEAVLEDVGREVPGLPLFTIDTTSLTVQQSAQEVLKELLPALCERYAVPGARYVTRSVELMRREANRSIRFEEQLKLRGIRDTTALTSQGWVRESNVTQDDICLNPLPAQADRDGTFQEITRLRCENGSWKFIYKRLKEGGLIHHRQPVEFDITSEEAADIERLYPCVARIEKERAVLRLDRDNHTILLHCDRIADLGSFTEIVIVSSEQTTHTEELLRIATDLGFTPADIVEESYLTMTLMQSEKRIDPA